MYSTNSVYNRYKYMRGKVTDTMRDRKSIKDWNKTTLLSLIKNMMGVKVTKKELANMSTEEFFEHQVNVGKLKAVPGKGLCMFCGSKLQKKRLHDGSSCDGCYEDIWSEEVSYD